MISSTITIGGHLTRRILCDDKGSPLSMPQLYPSLYQFRLKLLTLGDSGDTVLFPPTDTLGRPIVTALSASIGLIYAEPRAGTFKLRYGVGGDLTEAILFNEDAEDFKAKLGALPESATNGLAEVYQPTPGTWMCRFTSPDPVPILLERYEVELEPETFVRIRQFYQGPDYWLEVRLMQGPIASTSVHDIVLADPPTVSEIRRGYTDYPDILTVVKVNEIQAIYVPPGFRGTYIINFQGRQTRPLSANDGSANIQTALNALYSDGQTRFTVSNPEENYAYIEFVGPFSGFPFDLLEILIGSSGAASLTFDLNLNTTEVAEALRSHPTVDAIFEITLHLSDPDVPIWPGQDLVLFQAPVSVIRPLHWEGLVAAAPINWLIPPNPKDYIPFDVSQIITGNLTYTAVFGDGLSTSYSIDHMLGSDALHVSIRQNHSGGLLLRDDEYTVTFNSINELTIDLPAAPEENSLAILLVSHGPISQFVNHTHFIPQITGLQGVLDEIFIRLSALEAILPTQPPVNPPGPSPFGESGASVLDVTIPDIWNVVPTNRLPGKDKPTDPTKLPSQGLLLPAVHEAISLGEFTADPDTSTITLSEPNDDLVEGQRVRIDPPVFYEVGTCSFDVEEDIVTSIWPVEHGLVEDRKVRFTGETLPTAISPFFTYYVINPTPETFQLSSTKGGPLLPLAGATTAVLPSAIYSTISEPPTGLLESVDYFMINPTGSPTTTFQLSEELVTNPTPPPATIPGDPILFTDEGYPPFTMSTIPDAPAVTQGRYPSPNNILYIGHAFSVREQAQLLGGRGIRAVVVHPGDIVASDGRLWYPVTRSDSPGSNSFYPVKMENEIFRLAISDHMLASGCTLTCTFDLEIRMYKHSSNIQYLLVVEWADLPSVLVPAPTGPNIYSVDWSNRTPILQQKIIATELSFVHKFGVQVIRLVDGRLRTNKKAYGVEIAGDSIPTSANFAIRGRLIEFDTEDNVRDAQGLVYYSVSNGKAEIKKVTEPPLPVP